MNVPVQDLRCNVAQMRTGTRLAGLAQLAVQVQAGLDPALHLIGKDRDDGLVDIISGHRRWMACMVAHLALKAQFDTESALGLAEAFIKQEIPVDLNRPDWVRLLPETYYRLAEMCPGLALPIEIWEGQQADEIALLIAANVGSEEPDLVGMGKTFIKAVEADMSFGDLARITGRPVAMVEAIAEVPMLPDILQNLVRDGRLSLTVVPDLVRLDSRQAQGLGQAVKNLSRDGRLETHDLTNKVRVAISNMSYTPQEFSRAEVSAEKYNEACIARHLWGIALGGSKPQLVYEEMAREALLGYAPLRDGQALMDFLMGVKALSKYVTPHRGISSKFGDEALAFLPEDVNCATCAYAQLPEHKLNRDFPAPCREGKVPQNGRCIYGVPASEKFSIAIPWLWNKNAGTTVHKVQDLLAAFEGQRAYEESIKVEARPEANIETQRQDISHFVAAHVKVRFLQDHPWATNCAACKFHLEQSPVKADSGAPRCRWAKGRRVLHFEAYVDHDSGDLIAACRQYGPARSWAEIVPEGAGCALSREAMLGILKILAREYGRTTYGPESRGILQFLTGRPEATKDDHRQSFATALKQCQAGLSDAQLWTLVWWATLDYARKMDSNETFVPISSGETRRFELLPLRVALTRVSALEKEAGHAE